MSDSKAKLAFLSLVICGILSQSVFAMEVFSCHVKSKSLPQFKGLEVSIKIESDVIPILNQYNAHFKYSGSFTNLETNETFPFVIDDKVRTSHFSWDMGGLRAGSWGIVPIDIPADAKAYAFAFYPEELKPLSLNFIVIVDKDGQPLYRFAYGNGIFDAETPCM